MNISIKKIVSKNLCLGCGICSYDNSIRKLDLNKKKGIYQPKLLNLDYDIASKLCPAGGYNIIKESELLFPSKNISLELGRYDQLYAAHSKSSLILKKASSGGLITEFLIYLLNCKYVDKVAVTKFIYTENGPSTITFLTDKIDEILEAQGSKYCPVDVTNVIQEIKETDCKIAYVGTPCQIAGIRHIQKIDPKFNKNIIITIANFCGGFKSYNQIKKISQRHNISYNEITMLRYRGGGQPGGMKIYDNKGNYFEASYLKYGGFTGYSKMLRCHLCVDATGELADISFGDAWIDKYLKDSFPWSIVLTRKKSISSLIEQMSKKNIIVIEQLTEQQVINSQKLNLESKKIRQFTRMKLYKAMGFTLPNFDGGYSMNPTPIIIEIKVFLLHRIKEILERVGLYIFFRKLFNKEY